MSDVQRPGPTKTARSYAWAAKISTRYFCKTCGIYTHAKGHLEILGGDYVSVNLNCLDDFDVNAIEVAHWDGRHDNWMAGMRDTPWPTFTAAA